jgi:hypothetical protein
MPETDVMNISLVDIRTAGQAAEASARAVDCDLVFTSLNDNAKFSALSRSTFEARGVKVVAFPAITFPGFHPDMITRFRPGGVRIISQAGSTHSKLVLASYLLGLHEQQAAGLFNAYFYNALGYMSLFEKSLTYLKRSFDRSGYDLLDLLPEWMEDGAFMYTHTHPKLRVLWSVTKRMCEQIGVRPPTQAVAPTDDAMARGVQWPVYPEIARRIGVKGDLVFRRSSGAAIDLETFINFSYEAYRAHDPAVLSVPPIAEAIKIMEAEGLGQGRARPAPQAERRKSYVLDPSKRLLRRLGITGPSKRLLRRLGILGPSKKQPKTGRKNQVWAS